MRFSVKCYAPENRVSKREVDLIYRRFGEQEFTKRILVHTGGQLGANVLREIKPLGSDFQVISYGHLAGATD